MTAMKALLMSWSGRAVVTILVFVERAVPALAEVCDKVMFVPETWSPAEGAIYRGLVLAYPVCSLILLMLLLAMSWLGRRAKLSFGFAGLSLIWASALYFFDDGEIRAFAETEGCISDFHDSFSVGFYFVAALLFAFQGAAIRWCSSTLRTSSSSERL